MDELDYFFIQIFLKLIEYKNNYFKVNMSSIGNGNEPVILYYPDCESFERHHFINVPQNFKNEWSKKNKYVEQPKHLQTIVK